MDAKCIDEVVANGDRIVEPGSNYQMLYRINSGGVFKLLIRCSSNHFSCKNILTYVPFG